MMRVGLWLLFAVSCAPHPEGTQAPQSHVVPEHAGAAAAVVITGVAAGAYIAGGGCKIAGCPTHLACSARTERCVEVACTASGPACPAGSICEPRSKRCQTQPFPDPEALER